MSGTGLASITGNIGYDGAGAAAARSLDINSTDATTNTGGVTLGGNIGTSAAAGSGAVALGNPKTTGTVTLSGAEYNAASTQTYRATAFAINGTNPEFQGANSAIKFLTAASSGDVTLPDAANLTI